MSNKNIRIAYTSFSAIMNILSKGSCADFEDLENNVQGFPHGKDTFIAYPWIMNAIDSGSVECIRWMLSKNVKIDMIDDEGYSVLHRCIDRDTPDKYEILSLLLYAGANINMGCEIDNMAINGYSVLHLAAVRNDIIGVKLLLEHGADPYQKTKVDNYCTAAEEAYNLQKYEIAEYIINYVNGS